MSEQRKTWTSEVIRSERDTILRVWEEQVRVQVPGLDALPQPFLRDHLPRMLDALASWLDSDQHEPAFPSLSRAHGAQRLGHGVRLRDLMREYRVLREVIQRTFLARAAREPALAQAARDEEMVRFHRGLDFGATLSAESYASLREDALEALQERLRLALHSGGVGTWDYAPATRSFVIDPQGPGAARPARGRTAAVRGVPAAADARRP